MITLEFFSQNTLQMKKQVFILFFLFVSSFSFGQKVDFSLTVNKDTVLMNNIVIITYTIKQAESDNFESPDFPNFQVVSGPNVSTSISYINGDMTRESSYSFYLKPNNPGTWTIPAVTLVTDDGTLICEAKDIVVLPNPNGIIEAPIQNQTRQSQSPFFNEMPTPPAQHTKKKRKTYRL